MTPVGKRRPLLLVFAFLAIPIFTAFSQQDVQRLDGFDEIAAMQRNVSDVSEVSRNPIFDNAPFLHLRKGDKIVKAKIIKARGDYFPKGGEGPVAIGYTYHLLSGGKFYHLETEEKEGRLLLHPSGYAAVYCLLFDWDLTMANAKSLRQLLPGEYAHSLTKTQYAAIIDSVQKEFPAVIESSSAFESEVKEDRIISIPGHTLAEFQGIAYDQFQNCVYLYVIRIGPELLTIHGRTLLQGPPHVEPYEFGQDTGGLNASPSHEIDPKIAKIKKAEYARMIRFQKRVEDVIRPNRDSP